MHTPQCKKSIKILEAAFKVSQANPSEQEIEDYSQEWISNGNKQAPAWRVAFPSSQVSGKGAQEKASKMHKMAKVQARIAGLRASLAVIADERFGITAESLVSRLAEIDRGASSEGKYSASVAAVMGQAKLCGFKIDRVELSGSDGGAIKTESTFNFIPVGSNH